MPAYSFQKQFVPFIESGEKTHTIRGKRKGRPKPGQPFYGYYGMRTKQCRKILDGVITRVQDITIQRVAVTGSEYALIAIDGEMLTPDEMEALARRDGFADLRAMMEFWPDERLPFYGDIIHWKPGPHPGKANG
jgi:hypothetical protein